MTEGRPEPKGKTVALATLKGLPKSTLTPPAFEIDPIVEVEGKYYVFTVNSHHHQYRICSIPDLYKFCHEIDALVDYTSKAHVPGFLYGFGRNIGKIGKGAGRLVTSPVRAARGIGRYPARMARDYGGTPIRVLNPAKHPDGSIRTKHATGAFFSGAIRRFAWQMGVDAYTENDQLYPLLRSVAKRRSVGNYSIDFVMPSMLPLKLLKKTLSGGDLHVNTERAIVENGVSELRRLNARMYHEDLGVHWRKSEALETVIFNVYYSPREAAYTRAFLTRIDQREGLDKTFTYMGAVKDVPTAIFRFRELENQWAAHENHSPILRFAPFQNHLGVINKAGNLLVMVPWDHVAPSKELSELISNTAQKAKANAAKGIIWFTGTVEDAVQAEGAKAGVEIRSQARLDKAFGLVGLSSRPVKAGKWDETEHNKLKLARKAKEDGSTQAAEAPPPKEAAAPKSN
jgi:hypothetical protein